jgi:hypothetical protein
MMDRIAQLQFRSIPSDAQRATLRRLALRGLDDVEIAALTGWTPDQVRTVLQPPLSADFGSLIAARGRRFGSTEAP